MKLSDAWAVVKTIGSAAWQGYKLIRGVQRRVDSIPPTQPDSVPLTFRDVKHQQAQIDAATSHKVKR